MRQELANSQINTMRQSSQIVKGWLSDACSSINDLFDDEEYAEKHPELVGAFIQACAQQYLADRLEVQLSDITMAINMHGE